MSRYTVAELRHMRIKQIVSDPNTTDTQKSRYITLAKKDKKATLAKDLGLSASKAKRRSAKAVKRGSKSPRKHRSPNAYAKFVRAYHLKHPHLKGPALIRAAAAQWNTGKRTLSPKKASPKKRKTPTKKRTTPKRKTPTKKRASKK